MNSDITNVSNELVLKKLTCITHSGTQVDTIEINTLANKCRLICHKCVLKNYVQHNHNEYYFDLQDVLDNPMNFVLDRTRSNYNSFHQLQDYQQMGPINIHVLCKNLYQTLKQQLEVFEGELLKMNEEYTRFLQSIQQITNQLKTLSKHDSFANTFRELCSQEDKICDAKTTQLQDITFKQYELINKQNVNEIQLMLKDVHYQQFFQTHELNLFKENIDNSIQSMIHQIQQTTQQGFMTDQLPKEIQRELCSRIGCANNMNLVYLSKEEGLSFTKLRNFLNSNNNILILFTTDKQERFGIIQKSVYSQYYRKYETNYKLLNLPNLEIYSSTNFGKLTCTESEISFEADLKIPNNFSNVSSYLGGYFNIKPYCVKDSYTHLFNEQYCRIANIDIYKYDLL